MIAVGSTVLREGRNKVNIGCSVNKPTRSPGFNSLSSHLVDPNSLKPVLLFLHIFLTPGQHSKCHRNGTEKGVACQTDRTWIHYTEIGCVRGYIDGEARDTVRRCNSDEYNSAVGLVHSPPYGETPLLRRAGKEENSRCKGIIGLSLEQRQCHLLLRFASKTGAIDVDCRAEKWKHI